MRHDFVSLRLASIQHEARAFIAGEQTQSTRAVTVGTIEPSGLAGLQVHTVRTDVDRAADHVGKPGRVQKLRRSAAVNCVPI
jgi:hypothetical protein